jgi:hypothetical protein
MTAVGGGVAEAADPDDVAEGSGDEVELVSVDTAASSSIVTRGALCEISCGGAAAAGCAAVSLACAAGTVWTFGGISIPCQYAVVAACYAIGGGGVACAKLCSG